MPFDDSSGSVNSGVRTASGNHQVREQNEDNQKTDCCNTTTATVITVAGGQSWLWQQHQAYAQK
jgi:hypothetical protein